MAKPAFIYSFDNLGPYRFVELCAELLGARYKGFILGGVGADGGIDAEIDSILGEWYPEASDALSNQIIESGQTVVFQFKHKVTARTGQTNARTQLLNLYTGSNSEVTKELVVKKKPDVYVLITNVEINAQFRDSFQDVCRAANPNITYYQIISLDDLENWVTQATSLRHLYFPTIFDLPRYNLKLNITQGVLRPRHWQRAQNDEYLIQIVIYNIGMLPSYVSSIAAMVIKDGEKMFTDLIQPGYDPILEQINPKKGMPIEPGRRATYSFRIEALKAGLKNMFLSEIIVIDEIENRYSIPVPDDIRQVICETQ
jgi:hypothetical protein